MDTQAVVFDAPHRLSLRPVTLAEPQDGDVVVDIRWTGISAGTERLLWSGRMPPFPGMGYPLVPGYESVGIVAEAGSTGRRRGEPVFVAGSRGFSAVRGLFGGAAKRLVVPAEKALPLGEGIGEEGVLLALAATAVHAVAGARAEPPSLIVGHGVLGRLVARATIALGHPPPVVWETNPQRLTPDEGYSVIHPQDDPRRDYAVALDASGDPAIIDSLVPRLAPGGEIVLAGFYDRALAFAFPPAFMREARLRVAAQWQPADMALTARLVRRGRLSLAGLITHRAPAAKADAAYRQAFEDPGCLKMVLDWSEAA
jgi:3-hydroxyethyl bacteriochlorophyllide a dehydrogenase